MLGVVTGVGFLIHLYSAGYMAHEDGYWRFFAYLNLFMFFMLVLVLSSSFLLLFVGWEGVGLASYLLIGFYFKQDSAANAGKKAFIVNRIGDFGFLLAMFLLIAHFGSLDFATSFPPSPRTPTGTVASSPPSPSCSSSEPPASPPRFPSTSGCRTRWKAPPPSPPSSTPPPWSPPASTWSPAPTSSSIAAPSPSASSPSSARHRHLRRLHRHGAARHQARPRLLHRLAARLHVPRLRRRRLLRRHLPPAHPRLLQGPALPRRRLRHPRALRRAGHARHGRPPQAHPRHLLDHDRGRLRHRRHPALRRLLLKRRDPLPDLRQPQPARQTPLARRPPHRRHHLLLHVPPLVQNLLRRRALRRTRPRPASTHPLPTRRHHAPTRSRARRRSSQPRTPTASTSPPGSCSPPSSSSPSSPSSAAGSASPQPSAATTRSSTSSTPSSPPPPPARASALNADQVSHALEQGLAAVSVLVALLGLAVAWFFYYRKPGTAAASPAALQPSTRSSTTSSTSTSSTTTSSSSPLSPSPASSSTASSIAASSPAGPGTGAAGTRGLGDLTRRIQSGNIRSYAGWLALGAAAVIAVMIFGRSLWLHCISSCTFAAGGDCFTGITTRLCGSTTK